MIFFCKNYLDEKDLLRLEVLLALWQTFQEEAQAKEYVSFWEISLPVSHIVGEREGELLFYAQLKELKTCTEVRLIWHPRKFLDCLKPLDTFFSFLVRKMIVNNLKIFLWQTQSVILSETLLHNAFRQDYRECLLVFNATKKFVRPQNDWRFEIEFIEKKFFLKAYFKEDLKSEISTIALGFRYILKLEEQENSTQEEKKFILNNFLSTIRKRGILDPLAYFYPLEGPTFLPLETLLNLGFQRISERSIWIKT